MSARALKALFLNNLCISILEFKLDGWQKMCSMSSDLCISILEFKF